MRYMVFAIVDVMEIAIILIAPLTRDVLPPGQQLVPTK